MPSHSQLKLDQKCLRIRFYTYSKKEKENRKMSSRVTISGDGLDQIGGGNSGGVSGGRSNQSLSQRRQRSR